MNWQQLLIRAATHIADRKRQAKTATGRSGGGRRRYLLVAGVVSAPFGLILLVMLLGLGVVVGSGPAAAASGALGIPGPVFAAYLQAETNAPSIAADCEVDWPVVAGIWKVESNHATHGGRTLTPDGTITPPLYGPTLDGSTPETAQIPDSDNGLLDADPVWDRAVGPAQFLPGSWRSLGTDGNNDGVKDPQNVYDAALATVAHLCVRTPGDYQTDTDLARALRGYNNSAVYVEKVAGWVVYYRTFAFTQGAVTADGMYAFPLPVDTVTVAHVRRSHHDYPASDLMIPEGTPIYSVHPGTIVNIYTPCPSCTCGSGVTITGHDNHRYTYCHGSTVADHLQRGVEVAAGELIMASGNTGNSTTPHLHFQIRNPDGLLICPQPLLEAWLQGVGLHPITAPTSGCSH